MDHQEHIDRLLERYLELLDVYTRLRASLTSLHSGMYQAIARANFSTDRGVWYGQEHYDERMQALRRLSVRERAANGRSGAAAGDSAGGGLAWWACEIVDAVGESRAGGSGTDLDTDKVEDDDGAKAEAKAPGARDPLMWFGLMAPMPLRDAQAKATESVTRLVPELVMVDAEMRQLEIEIRRARKGRAEAEPAGTGGKVSVGVVVA